MTRFVGHIPPIVVEAVAICDRLSDQFGNRQIVERSQADAAIGAAHLLDNSMAVRRRPAFAAKAVMVLKALTFSRIVAEHLFAADQGEVFGPHLRVPVALLPAVPAIAFAAALEIHFHFKRYEAAVTASFICFQQTLFSFFVGGETPWSRRSGMT